MIFMSQTTVSVSKPLHPRKERNFPGIWVCKKKIEGTESVSIKYLNSVSLFFHN